MSTTTDRGERLDGEIWTIWSSGRKLSVLSPHLLVGLREGWQKRDSWKGSTISSGSKQLQWNLLRFTCKKNCLFRDEMWWHNTYIIFMNRQPCVSLYIHTDGIHSAQPTGDTHGGSTLTRNDYVTITRMYRMTWLWRKIRSISPEWRKRKKRTQRTGKWILMREKLWFCMHSKLRLSELDVEVPYIVFC